MSSYISTSGGGSKNPSKCQQCKRVGSDKLNMIENFLRDGVKEPPSRATKDEQERWITEHIRLLNALRDTFMQIYAEQINAMSSPTDDG